MPRGVNEKEVSGENLSDKGLASIMHIVYAMTQMKEDCMSPDVIGWYRK